MKKIILIIFILIMYESASARDVCPGQYHYVYYSSQATSAGPLTNIPPPFWICNEASTYHISVECSSSTCTHSAVIYVDNHGSCPKGTKLYGDLCLDKRSAKDPYLSEDSEPEEPEEGDSGDTPECINSYVIPKTREFHEDIDITGVSGSLHYSSARTTGYLNGLGDYVTTDIAHGWTLSNVHHFKAPYLYLGNGNMVKLKPSQYSVDINNKAILYDENHIGHQFDVDGKIIRSFEAVTEKTLFSFSYSTKGLLLSITDRFGLITSIVRDRKGKVLSIIAHHGEETKLNIDRKNNLLSVTYQDRSAYSFQYDKNALMTKEVDPIGNIFLHTYDSYGRVVTVTDAVGAVWDFYNTGNDIGSSVVMSDPMGETSMFNNRYLVNGLQVSNTTSPSGDVTTVTTTEDELKESKDICGLSISNTYGHDTITGQKRLTSNTITTPSGLTNITSMERKYIYNGEAVEHVEYIVINNTKKTTHTKNYTTYTESIISPESRSVTIQFDPLTELPLSLQKFGAEPVRYSYNTEGKLLTSKQGTRTDSYTYDERGNIATHTNPIQQVTHYEYDLLNRLIRINYPNFYSTLFSYDSNGNMLRLTTPTPADYTYTYNGIDKKTSEKSPLGQETQYSYDKKRRLINILKPSGLGIDFIYTNGQLASIIRPEGTIKYTYKCDNSVASITNGNESISYSHDGTLITQINYAGLLNESITYAYNSDFLATSIMYAGSTENMLYDNDNLLIKHGNVSIVRNISNGLTESISDSNYTQNRSYNNYGELTELSDNIFTYQLTNRDKSGAITQKIESINSDTKSYDYSYDDMGRLVEVKLNSIIVEEYSYDNNGNRASATINGVTTTGNYTLDDSLELYGNNAYRYSEDGYLSEKITPDGTTTYEYGTLGELKSVTSLSKTISYQHNANNQRVAKKVNGVVVEKYLWANLTTLLAIYDKDDNLVQRFVYADNRMPLSMVSNGAKYYLHYDQVGSLRAISDTNGNIIKEVVYDTFGNILSDSNPSFKVPFGFAGGLYDSDTKLTRFGYRDYDAYTGKWTAKDPIGFDGGDSNLYGYVLGDPVGGIDPMGLYDDPRFKRAFPNWNTPFWNPNGIPSKIAKGLGRDIPKMWDNAHPAAKACLVTAGIITMSPIAEAGYVYNNNNPKVISDFINGFNDIAPVGPGSFAYNTGNIFRKIIDWSF